MKMLLFAGIVFIAGPVMAGQIIAKVQDRSFVFSNGNERTLYCDRLDADGDGKAETSKVTMIIGRGTSRGLGLLQNDVIVDEIEDRSGEVCDLAATIQRSLPMSFQFLTGTFDSTLTLEEARLVEEIVIIAHSSAGPEKLILRDTVIQEIR